eukprot:2305669-Pyramimonas_sp.AAC.1
MKVAQKHESDWHMASDAAGWAVDKAKELRNMLRHVAQAVLRPERLLERSPSIRVSDSAGTASAFRIIRRDRFPNAPTVISACSPQGRAPGQN